MVSTTLPQRLEPSTAQLLTRLEKDIAWLKSRRLWNQALYERGVRRFLAAQGSTSGLVEFEKRHAPSVVASWDAADFFA
jgi:hypothetical protein